VPRVGTRGPVPVQINIYDVKGRHVRRLVHGTQEPGVYTTLWDGRDDRGTAVHSGVFFYRLQAGSTTRTRKMVLLR
jgi:flagellar hook assembly protein FlgD